MNFNLSTDDWRYRPMDDMSKKKKKFDDPRRKSSLSPCQHAFRKKHHQSHSTKNITFRSVVCHRTINSIPYGLSPFELPPRAAHFSDTRFISPSSQLRGHAWPLDTQEHSPRLFHSKNSFNRVLSFPTLTSPHFTARVVNSTSNFSMLTVCKLKMFWPKTITLTRYCQVF